MEEKEYSNVYAIPANYTDSGKLLGGMVEPRNAVEAVALVIMVGYPEVKWIPMPTTILHCHHDRDPDSAGSGRVHGNWRRLSAPVSGAYPLFLGKPADITLQEDRIQV